MSIVTAIIIDGFSPYYSISIKHKLFSARHPYQICPRNAYALVELVPYVFKILLNYVYTYAYAMSWV